MRKHGLSRWESDAEIAMASAMAADETSVPAALNLAHANLRLSQIRDVRHGMLRALMESLGQRQMKDLAGLERYEGARAKQRRVLKQLRDK